MRPNLASILTDAAGRDPEAVALKLDDVELSYGLLDHGTARFAGLLAERGIGPGDRVGIMLPNVPYFALAYYGTLRHGGVVVPMNVLLKGLEVAYYLEDSGTRLLFAWHGFEAAAREGAERAGTELVTVVPGEFEQLLATMAVADAIAEVDAEADTAVILYTSGTTGRPKGAQLTHANLHANCTITADTLGDITTSDTLLGALPLFHSFGQTCSLNAAVYAGARLSLTPRFDPEKALAVIERDAVTIFEGVPTMYGAMLRAPNAASADVSSLRLALSGGSSMPGQVMRDFETAFDCKVLEGYGLSETSPVASFNHPDRPRKAGSIGTPIEGVEMALLDDDGAVVGDGEVGEIAVRGHNVMKGYWADPDATDAVLDAEGWFRTGDLARRDDEGYYFIVDRKKDLIIRGGYNVYPREVEERLYEHPAVAEAAVVGIPDEAWGEEVGAAIVLKPGTSAEPEELRDFVHEALADYKYPRGVWLLDELPKGPTGKVLKREIVVPE